MEVDFPQSRVQNELIGAAATLIVEKFRQQDLLPQPQQAQLPYGSIFENTLNFLAINAHQRDHQAVE